MKAYEESLKIYHDNKNTMDYAIAEAVKEAVKEAVEKANKAKDIEMVRKLKQRGVDIEIIAETTSLTKKQIEKL